MARDRSQEVRRERVRAPDGPRVLLPAAERSPEIHARLVGSLHDRFGNHVVQAALATGGPGVEALLHDALALGASGVYLGDEAGELLGNARVAAWLDAERGGSETTEAIAPAGSGAGEVARAVGVAGEVFAPDAGDRLATALRRGGRALPEPVRAAVERAFGGADFGEVRIHADAASRAAAEAINARAFTVGTDIFFGPGELDVRSPDGQHLLLHELTHVVQHQEGRLGGGGGAGEAGGMAISSPADTMEREAEAMADALGGSLGPIVDAPAPEADIGPAQAEGLLLRDARPEGAKPPLSGGKAVQDYGIVYKKEGVNLRANASPGEAPQQVLPFNTRVFVDREEGGWYLVSTETGAFGYVPKTHVKTGLPEPDAKIHWIEPGETALSISTRYYGGKAEWGSDHRFYVNGLVFVNKGAGDRGIYKPDANAGWETTQVRAGYMIWVPSLAFLKTLRGTVSSGSITYEAWQKTKAAASAVGEFLLGGGAFIAGILHGAVESLWDVLVGLKDLAVMLWDILKSLLTGNLLGDAKGLWDNVTGLDWSALVKGWIDDFDARWNDTSILKRWHFRGWVVGYAVMEVLMLFFSGGVIQGIKWVGKSAKVAKVLQSLPRLQKLAETVKASKSFQKVAKLLDRGEDLASTASDAVKWVDRLLVEPKRIWGKSPEQLADVLRKAGCEVVVEQSKKGSKLSKQLRISGHKTIQNIQVHPGGGRHGGSYYKISTSTKGTIKVVDRATYVPTPGEKATIVFVDGGLQGWMLQAAAANAAAQEAGEEIGEGFEDE